MLATGYYKSTLKMVKLKKVLITSNLLLNIFVIIINSFLRLRFFTFSLYTILFVISINYTYLVAPVSCIYFLFSINCPVRQNNWTTVSTCFVKQNISTSEICSILYLLNNTFKSLAKVSGPQET